MKKITEIIKPQNLGITKTGFLSLVVIIYILRMAAPNMIVLFIPLFVILFAILLPEIIKMRWKRKELWSLLKHYLIFLLLVGIYIISSFRSGKINLLVLKDVIDLLVLCIFILAFFAILQTNDRFDKFKVYFTNQYLILYTFFCFLGLFRFMFLQDLFPSLYPLLFGNYAGFGSSLVSDYNFFALLGLFGIAFIILKSVENISATQRTLLNLLLILFTFSIIFSNSRRAIVILFFVIIGFIILRFIPYFSNRIRYLKNLRTNTKLFTFLILASILVAIFFFTLFSDQLRNQLILSNNSGKMRFKRESSEIVVRYGQLIYPAMDYYKTYDVLWRNDKYFNKSWIGKTRSLFDAILLKTHVRKGKKLRTPDLSKGFKDWSLQDNPECYIIKPGKSINIDSEVLYLRSFRVGSGMIADFNVSDNDSLKISMDVKILEWNPILRFVITDYYQDINYSYYTPKSWEEDGEWHTVSLDVTYPNRTISTIFLGGAREGFSVSLWKNLKIQRIDEYIENIAAEKEEIPEDQKFKNRIIQPELSDWSLWNNPEINIISADDTVSNEYIKITADQLDYGILCKINIPVQDTMVVYAFVNVEKWSPRLRLMSRISESSYFTSRVLKEWEGDNQWHFISLKVPFMSVPGNYHVWVGGGNAAFTSISRWCNIGIANNSTESKEFLEELSQTGPDHLPEILTETEEEILLAQKNLEKEQKPDSIIVYVEYFKTSKDIIKPPKPLTDKKGNTKNLGNYIRKVLKIETGETEGDSTQIISTHTDKVFASRIERWNFMMSIYIKDYNWFQKIFGGGFDFLHSFGRRFFNNPNRVDWPHNPFLSSLLFSGIFGTVIYIIFLCRVVYLYYKYRKELFIFLIAFILSFFFVFFSGNGYFDTPLYAVSLIIPYYYHYLISVKTVISEKIS